jgi:hypothetical protein
MHKECYLKHIQSRVIIRVDIEAKNRHTLLNGITIRRERRFNNLNFREVNPSNAFIVSAEDYPKGAEVLVDYTAIHDSNRIFDYESGSNDVVYYSIRDYDCFAWRLLLGEWQPTKDSEFGLRCYLPYEGNLIGIQPKFLKDVLFVTTGDLKGKVVRTVKGADYVIVYTNDEGKEGQLLRFRHSEYPDYDREEVTCIANDLTELYNHGKLLVGLNPNDAKTI